MRETVEKCHSNRHYIFGSVDLLYRGDGSILHVIGQVRDCALPFVGNYSRDSDSLRVLFQGEYFVTNLNQAVDAFVLEHIYECIEVR